MMQLQRLAALLLSLVILSSGALAQTQKPLPYLDPSLPTQQRVDDLVSRMTLDEKVAQLINTAPAIPRLDVPAYDWWSEGLHGIARSGYATLFPQAIGMAATWDAPLVNQIADVISTEARAKYNEAVRNNVHSIYYGLTIWSPNINIFRDPRWGRGQETYGEDPFLTARLGVAFVKGLQGDDPKYFRTIATPKHYAVHSGPEIHPPLRQHRPHSARSLGHLPPRLPRHHRRRQGRLHHVRLQRRRQGPRLRQQDAAPGHPPRRLEVPGLRHLRLRRHRRLLRGQGPSHLPRQRRRRRSPASKPAPTPTAARPISPSPTP